MSKIGRSPISIGNAQVEVKGQEVSYKGTRGSGVHVLPDDLVAQLDDKSLSIKLNTSKKVARDVNRVWGLHRAFLANEITGVDVGFEKKIQIVGLGYKAVKSGDNIVFSIGFSHKIDFPLPTGVSLEIDKTGQNLTFVSHDKALVGHVCSMIRSLRPPEPYKGTGIKLSTEVIARKAGKTKA